MGHDNQSQLLFIKIILFLLITGLSIGIIISGTPLDRGIQRGLNRTTKGQIESN